MTKIATVTKSRSAGKKATKATSRRKGEKNSNRKEKVATQYITDLPVSSNKRKSQESAETPSAKKCKLIQDETRSFNGTTTTVSKQAEKCKRIILMNAAKSSEFLDTSYIQNIEVPVGVSLPPKPLMPEPQMQPYVLVKRAGNVAKCHGCGESFDKGDSSLHVLKRKENDWYPKTQKDTLTKRWALCSKNFYYCIKFSCLLFRRSISRENVSIIYEGDRSAGEMAEVISNF